MDVKIKNNDIAVSVNGDPIYISGMDEVVQRIKIACSVKKGEFMYDRSLGCYDYEIDLDDELMCDKLSMIFKEATADVGYTDLEVLSIIEDSGKYKAEVMVKCGESSATMEVSIYE